MRDSGEPLSQGRLDRWVDEVKALRDAFLCVSLFTGVVLVNGILAILFIALMQALGLWTPVAAFISPEGADELRTSLHSLTDRRPSAPL